MPKVYAVFEGLSGGYLPNTVEYFTSKGEALRRMADIARELREEGHTVEGNAQTGYVYRHADQDWMPYGVTWEEYLFASRADAEAFISLNQEI